MDPKGGQPTEATGEPKQSRDLGPLLYEPGPPGHYGACQNLVGSGQGADPDAYTGIWSNINQGLTGTFRDVLATYWMATLKNIEHADHNYKEHQLPLARIKKVMKADPEVKMISAEAPILFAKGCDIFITELTMRAWIHAEENKRRTLQRSDIAAALSKSDMFDFLIDIVPREEAAQAHSKRSNANQAAAAATQNAPTHLPPQSAPVPPQPTHHAQPHEYAYMEQHDYRQPAMYAQDPAYGHPAPMAFDPNQAMYQGYGMPAHQMYPNQAPPPPSHGYRAHEGGDGDADAEGERDYEVA